MVNSVFFALPLGYTTRWCCIAYDVVGKKYVSRIARLQIRRLPQMD